ncbi:helix-turn-helix domain-containing protein [Glutamicibacter ardleyensis]|uniref:helix-turn-helix domain-containing protein n=1 Tax=Glutamicibacter ardleyensis TaxID=225894 RepID=UPI003FD2518E
MKIIDSAQALGQAIRGARIALGLTQQALAESNGLSRKFIGELESGKGSIELGSALKVAKSLGIIWGAPDPTPQMVLDKAARDIAEELSAGDREFALRLAMDALKYLKTMKPERLKKPRPTGSEQFDALLAAGARLVIEGSSPYMPRWGKKLSAAWFPGSDTRNMGEAFRLLTIKRTPKMFADFNIYIKDNSLEIT